MALIIAPSEVWEGNDGPWSSFVANIGYPPQQVRLLPATSQTATFPILTEGCPSTYPTNCNTSRGQVFDADPSVDLDWSRQYASGGDPYFVLPFATEASLGYNANCEAGNDTLSLAWSGLDQVVIGNALPGQVIAGYAAPNPWLGMLGISGRPSHLFNASSNELSPLQSLVSNNSILSTSWGYTAGAQYVNPPTFGSLTFGGYDAARVDMDTSLTVPFGTDTTRDLYLAITAITIRGSSVAAMPIWTVLDSVVPEIWLPLDACATFESEFGLVWNNTVQMYLINDTQRQTLLDINPTVAFTLAASPTSNQTTTVTLPYSAFDLTATFPLAGIQDGSTSQHYFPLKRAANDSQYFLGRTFFQEAYVAADYDRRSFNLGQALFPSSQATTNIVTVFPESYRKTQSGHGSLSKGAIAGIVIGVIAAIALIAGALFWFTRRRRQKKRRESKPPFDHLTIRTGTSMDATTVVAETEAGDRDNLEFYKPPPGHLSTKTYQDGEFYKPELDANETVRRLSQQKLERHELAAAPSTRPGHRTFSSWGSAQSGVSPLGDQRVTSMIGEPSPPLDSAGFAYNLPRGVRRWSSRSPQGVFEMPGELGPAMTELQESSPVREKDDKVPDALGNEKSDQPPEQQIVPATVAQDVQDEKRSHEVEEQSDVDVHARAVPEEKEDEPEDKQAAA